ncbi:hypothetical protein DPMN_131926 [Dreissena polymorpha]|uniref:Uncharacterized protein n=1 Tax=Dreissena polymorpha TaxID=45954 RepID=A0A9D4J9M0_DREPO|nr:hypothetical protein DPMN_131926 [Dreissena polymorpha]
MVTQADIGGNVQGVFIVRVNCIHDKISVDLHNVNCSYKHFNWSDNSSKTCLNYHVDFHRPTFNNHYSFFIHTSANHIHYHIYIIRHT